MWWVSKAPECPADSPIPSWPSPSWHAFNCRLAYILVSGSPPVGNMVDYEEMGLCFEYGRGPGSRWTTSWHDFDLTGRGYDTPIANSEDSCGLIAGSCVCQHCCQVGEYDIEGLCWNYRQIARVVSITLTEFGSMHTFRNPHQQKLHFLH